MDRRPVVGVVGGGTVPDEVRQQARQLGRRIAERGWILLNGGRAAGVMAASARGAHEADGLVLGVLPGRGDDEGVSGDLTAGVFTGMGDARNAINVLSSDVLVACRGGAGTLSEVALGVKAGCPVVLLSWPDEEVPAQIADALARATSPREAVAAAAEELGAQGWTL